ncbi:MAG: endopeptidase La [Gemmatimonadales bacterium]|jgi:ATP-dependent Lon protease
MSEEDRTHDDALDGEHKSDDDMAEPDPIDNGPKTVSEGANGDPEAVDGRLSERSRLPVLPLRGTVTFPAVAAPIAAGRDMTLKAIEASVAGDKRIFAVAQKDAEVEEPDADELYRVGTIARIAQMQRVPGGVQMVIQGEERGAALEYAIKDGYMEVVSRRMEDMPPLDAGESAFAALYKEVRERAAELSRLRGVPKEIVDHLLGGISTPGELADLVAFYTELDTDEKQELLETLSVEDRLRKLLIHLQRQIGVLEAQEQIRSKVQEELGERQREIFLREQLKAIHKELGEDVDSQEVEELRERIEALKLPDEARKEVDRELRRLERIPRETAEAQVIRTYLEIVADLPWSKKTEGRLDLKAAEEILERDHYGLQDVKDRVLDFLAVRKLHEEKNGKAEVELPTDGPADNGGKEGNGLADEPDTSGAEHIGHMDDRTGSTLLFVGPPGVGKTSIAKSIAEAMGRKYVRVSLGGARDEADIRGHRRTYVGALPGRIVEGLKRAGTRNPVFLLDEVDKLGVSFQGDPSAALMEVLDPAQNNAFVDHYLGVPFDLSDVFFIATANFWDQIPGPLRDRMEAIEFLGYTEGEKLEIAKRFLLPRQVEQSGLERDQITVADEAIRDVIASYTREAGVRNLERELGAIARKSARKVASGESESVTVGTDDLRDLLGQPKVHPERMLEMDRIGVATGMSYTPAGGDIMVVETSVRAGKEDLQLTGHLGDVMKESAQAALTYALGHADELGIPDNEMRSIHVHVPAGAVPKEGPSAGVAMSASLVSALSGRPVRHDVAMTGEISLTGRVRAIGGVKEKVLGAYRAGIREIILPRDNEGDLEELPDRVREQTTFHLVDSLGEAMAVAIPSGAAPASNDAGDGKPSPQPETSAVAT